MQEDLKGVEPTLNAEAGLTADAARVAHGYADDELHAGFISKQAPLPHAEPGTPQGTAPGAAVPKEVLQGFEVEPAEDREPILNAEAGLTAAAAKEAHGYSDEKLNAGFISKQTPRS